jgi:hypothetical protein
MPDSTNDITVSLGAGNSIDVSVTTIGPPDGIAPQAVLKDYSIQAQVFELGDLNYTANLNSGNSFQITLTADSRIRSITGWPGAGLEGKTTLYIRQGAGPFTLGWPTSIKWVNGAVGELIDTPGSWSVFTLTSMDAGITVFGFHIGDT